MRCPRNSQVVLVIAALAFAAEVQAVVNYEEEPIAYRKTKPDNRLSQLQERIDRGDTQLRFDPRLGYLPALLAELEIPVSSQVMPFAKVSRQKPKISPETPRALYFTDDAHVGYVQDGLIEVAVTDPALGMVFYTLEQVPQDRPTLVNASASCLTCHGTSKTRNVPGLQVRSVIPDMKGEPVLAAGSYRTDHASPLEKRWGGWYVTGSHGGQEHLGNLTLAERRRPDVLRNEAGQNVKDLSAFFDTTKYLTDTSDIVALMVLEHQADMTNFITMANFASRAAAYRFEKASSERDADLSALQSERRKAVTEAGDRVLSYLLFEDETPLTAPVEGVSSFCDDFLAAGPRDEHGRTLREFDLQTRMFRHRVSYMIYADAFKYLPDDVRRYVLEELAAVLNGTRTSGGQMTEAERLETYAILMATHAEFSEMARARSTGASVNANVTEK